MFINDKYIYEKQDEYHKLYPQFIGRELFKST